MDIKAPPGVFDILPSDPHDEWKNSHIWTHVESLIRSTAKSYGYQEIRTPIIERTELFQRGVGETSDIVSKEMYTFEDRGGRSITLRPEGTAPVIRAFLEHNVAHTGRLHKFFYICPMFRYERSQAGRYRQHHQFGAEAIGNEGPEQDAELIDLLYTLYTKLGLKDLKVMINSIGDTTSRMEYKKALQDYLKSSLDKLSGDSQARFETNPLRILDSKDPQDKELLKNAPSILSFLNSESKDHFEMLQKLLESLKIPFEVNPKIVRGLDYYNRTVFEVVAEELGAQNSIGGGGRYDGLIHQLGGPDLPALGFGTGIERIIQVMLKQKCEIPLPNNPTLYFIPLGPEARKVCFQIMHQLRQAGIHVQMELSDRKLNKAMQHASQINAKFTAVVGDNELASEKVELKEMASGQKIIGPLYHLSRILRIEAEGEDFIRIWKELVSPFQQPLEAKFFLSKIDQSIQQTKQLAEDLQEGMKKMKQMLEE